MTSASCGSSEPRARWLGLPGWVWLVLLVAATGSYCIGTPFSGSFRECYTAIIACNLWQDGPAGLLWPRIDWLGGGPGYMIQEFPFYVAAVASLYGLLGEHEWLGLVVSLAFSLGGVLLLYGIVRRVDGEQTALAAGALMALMPLQQSVGQVFMPEPLMMLLFSGAMYAMLRHAQDGQGRWLALATVAAVGSMLVKAPAGLAVLVALAYLAWTRDGWGCLRRPALWLALAVALGSYVLWQWHSDRVNAVYYPSYVSSSAEARNWFLGPLALRLDWHFYARIAGRLLVYLSPLIALAALAGLFRRPAGPQGWLFHVWLAGNVGYVLLCANLHFAHKYYQIVFVPIGAALAARAVVALWPRWRWALVGAAAALVLYDGAIACKLWREQRDPRTERAGALVRHVTAPQDLVLVADFHARGGTGENHWNVPTRLYAAQRRGWNVPLYAEFDVALVERYRRQGARWLLVDVIVMDERGGVGAGRRKAAGWHRILELAGMTNPELTRLDEKLLKITDELTRRYRCAQSADGIFLFDLGGS